ncbi:MAG: chromosomal replication initiator protein DnaA [Bryobacterales bacterium]|nr:chromosomal replication initiator protein DnaA [Bryobacterales bacterium]
MNAWDEIKIRLESELSAESFQNWVQHTRFIRIERRILWVSVPDEETRNWLESEYAGAISPKVRAAGLTAVAYELSGNANGWSPSTSGMEVAPRDPEFTSPVTQLNPKFSFDTFVVGACNQFAHAAAKSVATTPSRSYNPLFLYGGVGIGKTHLMHAIGRSLIENYSGMRIVYTSSERFMNEMIACIRSERMAQFHQHYRSADVLLVDDIQVLGNKERTQEEFFHTFNDLFDHQKQIVISSDSSPKEIPGLVERLRSRFEWGLMVDMQPPDLETKMAILDKKAGIEGVQLPEEVRAFIATRTKGNVRELEGALIKLIAFSSLTDAPITLQMAHQMLKHLSQAPERRVTIDAIQKAVADHYSIKQSQLKEKSNRKTIVEPRQVAMYLVKELTAASLPEIGRAFGGKHHTTVIHSIQRVMEMKQTNAEINRLIHRLLDSLQ